MHTIKSIVRSGILAFLLLGLCGWTASAGAGAPETGGGGIGAGDSGERR